MLFIYLKSALLETHLAEIFIKESALPWFNLNISPRLSKEKGKSLDTQLVDINIPGMAPKIGTFLVTK